MEDRLSAVIGACMAAIIGIALITQGVIPIAIDFIGDLTGEGSQWQPLLNLVITITILSLIIGVLSYFRSSR